MSEDHPPAVRKWTPALFERERRIFQDRKAELLLHHEGKFVSIRGDVLIGPFETREEALTASYERFGLGPFYMKEIREVEPVITITRDILPWRS